MPDPYWQGTSGFYPQQQIWQGWQTTSATAATTIWDPWAQWQQTQPVTIAVPSLVWVNWQTTGTLNVGYVPGPVLERSPERARDVLIRRQRSRASGLRRKIAQRRAQGLLLEHLTAEQRREWETSRAFIVHTADGKRAYRIEYGLAGNVRLVKADEAPVGRYGRLLSVGARFCMHVYHPDGPVPNEDNVLAQKLLLEADERQFLDLANVS